MAAWIHALLDPRRYPHPVGDVRLIETHISWLLLTGDYAYKIKKPVDLGFVDFTSLARRRYFCAEEVRLNRRYAPGIYLDVIAVTGSERDPHIGGNGTTIDYAVQMRQFDQEDLLDRRLARGCLTPADIDALATACASFHASAPRAADDASDGSADALLAPALDNFETIAALVAPDTSMRTRIGALEGWTRTEHARLAQVFARRKAAGCIRECHGDLHLRNIAIVDGRITPFDCIEFDAALRWIDVMSEMAFTAMDLDARGRSDLACRLLDRYLEASGDYEGLTVLRFYLVYRALVRAKVDCIHAAQDDADAGTKQLEARDFHQRVALAERYAQPGRPFLAITCGVSGSGKTHASQIVLERTGALRLRSDVERKRLHGLAPNASSVDLARSIYDEASTTRTFDRLRELARTVIAAGYPVIVDATFLLHSRRAAFAELAHSLDVPFVILDCVADDDVLEARIADRLATGQDASEADIGVMRRQKLIAEPLDPSERAAAITIHAADPSTLEAAASRLQRLGSAA